MNHFFNQIETTFKSLSSLPTDVIDEFDHDINRAKKIKKKCDHERFIVSELFIKIEQSQKFEEICRTTKHEL